MTQCSHLNLKIIYMKNEEGSVQLEICKNDKCGKIVALCEHKTNKWVYTRNQEDPDEQNLFVNYVEWMVRDGNMY